MNENPTYFQPQQTPYQSSQQFCQDAPPIDPQNPFENSLENPAYRTDYRRVLPQIALPGFRIPIMPEREERRAIRKSFNAAGLGCVLCEVLCQGGFFLLIMIVLLAMGVSPMEYFEGGDVSSYLEKSSIFIAMNGLIFSVLNTAIALIGCRCMKIPSRSLFATQDFTAGKAALYMCIGIGLQAVAGWAYQLLEWFLNQNGIESVEADFSYYTSGKSILAMVLYACILAPITEELLYRGFLMKTLSRVSVRFGIIVSALMFGLAHGNPAQFLLGFLVGIFLGKIDMRHNSLIPSILVHMAINTMATVLELIMEFTPEFLWDLINGLTSLGYLAVALTGIVLWFCLERKKPLPYPTQKQAIRCRVAWSSPWLLVAFALQIGMLLLFGLEM